MKIRFFLIVAAIATMVMLIGCSSSDTSQTQQTSGDNTGAVKAAGTFAVKDIDGNIRNFDEFKANGPVILNFWGTWCPPCRRELPDLKKIYHEYKDQGLQLVGLAINDSQEKVKKFAAENDLDWVMLIADQDAAESFQIGNGVPVTIFIDRDGNEVTRMIGARDYDTFKKAVEKII